MPSYPDPFTEALSPPHIELLLGWLSSSSTRASVRAIKLLSTPYPDFADTSNTVRPVRLVNSWMSSSETSRSGCWAPPVPGAPSAPIIPFAPSSCGACCSPGLLRAYSTRSCLFAITIIYTFHWALLSTSFSQLSRLVKLSLLNKSKTRMIPWAFL